jgi:sugar-specific transcriptional regulator TrmB
MNMELENELKKLGLNEIESKIYLSLLKLPQQSTVKLSKNTGINRRTIYDNLELLITKGLVTYNIISGTKYFNANDVKILKQLIDEKLFTLENIMPTLRNLQETNFENTKIDILMGKQGIKTILENAIETNQTVYWIGGGLHLVENFKFSKYIQEKFSKLNIKLLQPKTKEISKRLRFFTKIEYRFLPEKFSSSVGFIIYENKLIIGKLDENEIISIIINGKEFADTFRIYFKMLWDIGQS